MQNAKYKDLKEDYCKDAFSSTLPTRYVSN